MKDELLQIHEVLFREECEMPFTAHQMVPDGGKSTVLIIIFAPNDLEVFKLKKWLTDFEYDPIENTLLDDAGLSDISELVESMTRKIKGEENRNKVFSPSVSFSQWIDQQLHLEQYTVGKAQLLRLPGFPYTARAIVLAKNKDDAALAIDHFVVGKRNDRGLSKADVAIGNLAETWHF